jgi:tetratricopeptide (TPR) repeat protein
MLRAGFLAGSKELARFRTEAEAAARLQHPNIVPIYEIGEWRGDQVEMPLPYLVMEYVDGGSLDQFVAGTPEPPRDAARLVETLARAVHHAHERQLVHRDLKPANILLSFTGPTRPGAVNRRINDAVPKITDFGLAKRLEESGQTASRDIIGTPSYMAPEQAMGRSKEVGPGADVYALGAILYELLTGSVPFKGATPIETLQQVTTQEPVEPRRLQSQIPRDLNTICLKCLEKTPSKRYGTAAELANDLQRFASGAPIHARPFTLGDRIGKWVKRYPAAAGLIATLILGIIGTTTAMMVAWKQRDRAAAAEIQSHLDSARLAIQRGAWSDALARYEDAEKRGHPLSPEFRLQKIRAWAATDKLHEATSELNNLARDPLSPEQDALVKLYRGHLLLGGDDSTAEGLIREALQNGNLPPAEAFCARGILAGSSLQALGWFDRAISEDPYHQGAREMASTVLITLGRLEEAWTYLIRSEALFPEHRGFQFLLANVETLRGNREEAMTRVKRIRGKLRDNEASAIQALIESYDPKKLTESVYFASHGQTLAYASSFLMYKPVLAFISRPSDSADDRSTPTPALRIRTPVYFRQFGHDLSKYLIQTMGFHRPTDVSIRELERLVEIHPEGSLCYLYAAALLIQSQQVETRTEDVDAKKSHLEKTRNAFLRALDAPSIIPVRPLVLDGLIATELLIGMTNRSNRDSAMLADGVRHIRERLTLGPFREPSVVAICFRVALEANELALARFLMSDWERLAPKDKMIAYRRAQLELRAGAFGPAVKAAQQAVARDPANEDAKRLLETATKKLHEERQTENESPY